MAQQSKCADDDLIAETAQRNARQRAFVWKFYATFLAGFYMILFLGVGFRVWQSTWKKEQSAKNEGDQSDKEAVK